MKRLFPFVLVVAGCSSPPPATPPVDGGATDARVSCATDETCDDGVYCNGREICMAGACVSVTICEASQRCDEARQVCVTDCAIQRDADGDGSDARECGGLDCDDSDAARNPGASEVCDSADRDEDCDATTFGFRDGDGDGAGSARCCNVGATGERTCGTDCDDARPGTNPTAPEVCNTLDDDCDGRVDEDVIETFYVDADGDGFGSAAATAMRQDACLRPRGFAPTADDCDDTRASINPSAVDVCDAASLDEDCSGVPNDPVGGCTCTGSASRSCGLPGRCASGVQNCVAGNWSACSSAPVEETCNGEDDDCDGDVDEGQTVTCFLDADGDGYARFETLPVQRCPVAARMAAPWLGCPDLYTGRLPAMPGESDCDDSQTTLTLPVQCWTDADRDTYGTGDPVWDCPTRCTGARATRGGDCCDTDDRARPSQTAYFAVARACGGYDYDCSGRNDLRWQRAGPCMQTGPQMCTGTEGLDRANVPCGQQQAFYAGCNWFSNMFGSGCTGTFGDPLVRPQECR